MLLTRKIPEATITLEIDESYTGVILLDGKEMFVPIDENNRHYAEIKAQVDAGTLTIEDAD